MFDAAVLKDAVVSIIWDRNIGVNKPMANLEVACVNFLIPIRRYHSKALVHSLFFPIS